MARAGGARARRRCAFADDDDARAHGARKLRVAVLGARGVAPRGRGVGDGAPPADVKANLARLGRSAFGFARRLRSGDLPNPLGAEDAAAPAPFVRVEVERDGARTRLGRTNTEYASVAPSFGANARAERSCPHAAPRTAFEAEEGAARLVAGSDLSPLGVAPVLEAYAPAAGAGASLVLTLLDERYSVERGVVGEVIGEARIARPAPSTGPPAPAGVPVGGSGAEASWPSTSRRSRARRRRAPGRRRRGPARVARRRARPRPRRPGTTAGCAATARRRGDGRAAPQARRRGRPRRGRAELLQVVDAQG